VYGAAEVILVLGFGYPTCLPRGLAGCSAPGSENSSADADGCADQNEITSDSNCICAIPTSHRVPSCEGSIIDLTNGICGIDKFTKARRTSTHRRRSQAPPATASNGRFKSVVLGEIQTGADTWPPYRLLRWTGAQWSPVVPATVCGQCTPSAFDVVT
jgi:hypothetical protein